MAVSIRKIHIENFRSIRRLNVDTSALSIFVGKNDSGKSNVLRALNLFFNGETNPGRRLIFSDDLNFNYTPPARKAKEITVRLEIEIPRAYQTTNGAFIVWEKRWRAEGETKDNYHGIRIVRGQRGGEKREVVEIPEKSNLHSLLKKIEYQYIPAIKDSLFFDSLRGRIYGIISEVADETFRISSTSFEDSIGEHLQDLTSDIVSALGFETRLALPRDLSHVFQKLDFLSGDKAVSLENRGDGIKARNIPLILKFMAEKKRSLQVRGSMPYSFIWGYEEPENNLELANCVNLADEFWSYTKDKIAQIILTTHSPVFYNLQEKNDTTFTAKCFHVFFQNEPEGTVANHAASDLDEKMGTMALFAPKTRELETEIRNREESRSEAKHLALQNRPKIFVEGESDQLIIQKALEIFSPDNFSNVDVETKPKGAGHNYVKDMMMAWRSQHKHHPERPKAVGIVDSDDVGSCVRREWNRESDNIKSCKCFNYTTPTHIRAALSNGFKLPITLEVLYPKSIWEWSLHQEIYLVDRKLSDVIPSCIREHILREDITIDNILEDEWCIYIKYDYNPLKKKAIARHLISKPDDEVRVVLSAFEGLINDIISYLFPIIE